MANSLKITTPRGAVPVVEFYGTFGEGELTPEAFAPKWRALGNPKKVNLFISSPGGSCFAANAIFDIITRSGTEVHVFIDGIAASMGSLIAMVGAHITIGANALTMVHNPAASVGGSSEDLKRGAALLESIRVRMVSVYAKRTGLSEDTIVKMMNAETWMDADEAIRLGFADDKGADLKLAATAFDLSGYHNTPPVPAPRTPAELATAYWQSRGKGPATPTDLVPKPITYAEAFANLGGKHAGRRR